MSKEEILEMLIEYPSKFADMLEMSHEQTVEFTEMHNEWIKNVITPIQDETLVAHRGSKKTTCGAIGVSIKMILQPNLTILFVRKVESKVAEIISTIYNILNHEITRQIIRILYGIELEFTKRTTMSITTNLTNRITGTEQLTGMAIGSSATGGHYDFIWFDDITDKNDRYSERIRIETIRSYLEFSKLIKDGSYKYHTATPWHYEDCLELVMPNKKYYDCYTTGLMTEEQIEKARKENEYEPGLFECNYELKHTATKAKITLAPARFIETELGYSEEEQKELLIGGVAHIDAAYSQILSSDFSALTLLNKKGNNIYVYGMIEQGDIRNCLNEFLEKVKYYKTGRVHTEINKDEGFLADEIERKGVMTTKYRESKSKHQKITEYIIKHWNNIIFLDETDREYIRQIMQYFNGAKHDDAIDSLASALRILDEGNSCTITPISLSLTNIFRR